MRGLLTMAPRFILGIEHRPPLAFLPAMTLRSGGVALSAPGWRHGFVRTDRGGAAISLPPPGRAPPIAIVDLASRGRGLSVGTRA